MFIRSYKTIIYSNNYNHYLKRTKVSFFTHGITYVNVDPNTKLTHDLGIYALISREATLLFTLSVRQSVSQFVTRWGECALNSEDRQLKFFVKTPVTYVYLIYTFVCPSVCRLCFTCSITHFVRLSIL